MKQRIWLDYADLQQGDVVLEHRHGQVLTEREERVPSLPTEPYTVIRAKWEFPFAEWDYVLVDDKWRNTLTDAVLTNVRGIASVTVLSEPRSVTAKAVLARVREVEMEFVKNTHALDRLYIEFGVSND